MVPTERALRFPLLEAPAASRCGVAAAPHWASWSPWSSGRRPTCEDVRGVGTRVAPQVRGPKEAQGGAGTCGVCRQARLRRLWAWSLPLRMGKEASVGAEWAAGEEREAWASGCTHQVCVLLHRGLWSAGAQRPLVGCCTEAFARLRHRCGAPLTAASSLVFMACSGAAGLCRKSPARGEGCPGRPTQRLGLSCLEGKPLLAVGV